MSVAFVSYAPVEKHGVIGDRRTAALVAADGTIDWCCLPRYDSDPVFGAILDAARGGFWRLGPYGELLGEQRGYEDTGVLVTRWETDDYTLELTDAMLLPETRRAAGAEDKRQILRRLRCLRGTVRCIHALSPRQGFGEGGRFEATRNGLVCEVGPHHLGIWSSLPLLLPDHQARSDFDLEAGEEVWAVLSLDETPVWTVARARAALDSVIGYWHGYLGGLCLPPLYEKALRRSAVALHLLTYAPTGAFVAAPTTSLPERPQGDLNWDYRYCWIRDGALSAGALLALGDLEAAERFWDWLSWLDTCVPEPLQVVYRVDGDTALSEACREDLEGYRCALPVRFGNRAVGQRQLGALGYPLDLLWRYVEAGGTLKAEYWQLVRRCADYLTAHWQLPDNGIWELPGFQPYVASKAMAWVALDRACRLAEHLGAHFVARPWREAMRRIRQAVWANGYDEVRGTFTQRFGAPALDAALLLLPIYGFIDPGSQEAIGTREAVRKALTRDDLTWRFVAAEMPDMPRLGLEDYEAAFLPCTFWLAHTYALAGCERDAEAIIESVLGIAGDLGFFAEEATPGRFRGNTPLLFSHAAFVQAALALVANRQAIRR
ncbi:MAG TPA: glycoside hydrolase family 15 protein [Oscillatoriaceae cyanobacterium]